MGLRARPDQGLKCLGHLGRAHDHVGSPEIDGVAVRHSLHRFGEQALPVRSEIALAEASSVIGLSRAIAGQIGMLVGGLGVSQTYASVARHLVQSGALLPVLEDCTDGALPISVVNALTKRLNARVRTFVDWVKERLSSEQSRAADPLVA
ncbi:type 2 periplasmic-binding domain-containing protein [Roseomonas populi]|uniref:LysR substrate-binding domain-containing protein n=1 Tax=Roseomonas populi TaxID=3121582 RepID=A0ABT1X5T3_9PROT|nr:hypothetical protein [Roseomonas pecuniae]MCR0983094.1 hypothetical protein [Roseomonas pecuniae]